MRIQLHTLLSLTLLASLISGSLVQADLNIPLVSQPPVLDGKSDDPAWAQAPSVTMDYVVRMRKATPSTRIKLCRTDENLYVLFECDEPNPACIHKGPPVHDGQLWWYDSVMLLLAPDAEYPEECYKILVATPGEVWDCWYGPNADIRWNSNATTAVHTYEGGWNVELAIPFASLSRSPITTDNWSGNFGRVRHQNLSPTTISWQEVLGTWREPERFAPFNLKGISNVPAIKEAAQILTQKAAKRALQQIENYQTDLLPAQPESSCASALASKLQILVESLQTPADSRSAWTLVRQVNNDLPFQVSAAQLAEQSSADFAVYQASPMNKLRATDFPTGQLAQDVQLHAARGEAESTQFVLVAPEGISGMTAQASSFTGPDGTQIQPELRLVKYVPVHEPSVGGPGLPGLWPDPLFTMRPFDIPKNQSQAVWLTVWVPQDAPAGPYQGNLTFTASNDQKSIPISLHVHNVNLPVLSKLQTYMYCHTGYPDMQDLLLKNRQCPMPALPWDHVFTESEDGTITANWQEFDLAVEKWKSKGATTFTIGNVMPGGTRLPAEDIRNACAQRLQLANEHLTAKGWTNDFFFYLFDEPAPEEIPNLCELCAFIHKHGPNLQVMMTCLHAEVFELAGSIDVWSPQAPIMYPFFNQSRQAHGEKIWPYICIGNTGIQSCDNWKIDFTGVSHRALGAWLWKYQCDGFLYWRTTAWMGYGAVTSFQSTVSFPFGNGDGYTMYPGDGTDGSGAVPSIRLELTRDAFEDYDLLALLKQAADQTQKRLDDDPFQPLQDQQRRQTWLSNAQKLLDTSNLIPAMLTFDPNPTAYETRHNQILQLLENPPQ